MYIFEIDTCSFAEVLLHSFSCEKTALGQFTLAITIFTKFSSVTDFTMSSWPGLEMATTETDLAKNEIYPKILYESPKSECLKITKKNKNVQKR